MNQGTLIEARYPKRRDEPGGATISFLRIIESSNAAERSFPGIWGITRLRSDSRLSLSWQLFDHVERFGTDSVLPMIEASRHSRVNTCELNGAGKCGEGPRRPLKDFRFDSSRWAIRAVRPAILRYSRHCNTIAIVQQAVLIRRNRPVSTKIVMNT